VQVTQQDLDHFHEFASEVLRNGGKDSSLEDLIAEWRAACERNDVHAAIREGLDDVRAGRVRPAAEVTNELRTKYGLPAQ
jgi:hypothetical protein